MRLFKSKEANLVHYVTGVTYNRFPVFRDDYACALFIDALAMTRLKEPFKLIGYVVMPDHFHLLVNPLWLDISLIIGRLKGRAASLILKWLRAGEYSAMLTKLQLAQPLTSGVASSFVRNLITSTIILFERDYAIILQSGAGRVIKHISRMRPGMFPSKSTSDGCGLRTS